MFSNASTWPARTFSTSAWSSLALTRAPPQVRPIQASAGCIFSMGSRFPQKTQPGPIYLCRTVRRPIMDGDLAMALGWSVGLIALFYFPFGGGLDLRIAGKNGKPITRVRRSRRSPRCKALHRSPCCRFCAKPCRRGRTTPARPTWVLIQAKAYYRAETIKKIAEMQGAGADTVLAVLREEERISGRRTREGLKLAGFITGAVGLGLIIRLRVDRARYAGVSGWLHSSICRGRSPGVWVHLFAQGLTSWRDPG